MPTVADSLREDEDLALLGFWGWPPVLPVTEQARPRRPSAIDRLLDAACAHGQPKLLDLCRRAVARLLEHPNIAHLRLFNRDEQAELAELLAAVTATAEGQGRAAVHRKKPGTAPVRESREDVVPIVPVRRQSTEWSCGASALLAAADALGVNTSGEGALIRQLGTDPVAGTRPAEIVSVARKLGLSARAAHHCDLDRLAGELTRGAVLLCPVQLWGGGHWVVLISIGDKQVSYMDPASGFASMNRGSWQERWWDTDREGSRYERYAIALSRPTQTTESVAVLEDEGFPAPILEPTAALDYFTNLFPTLGKDPLLYGEWHRRQAFTLAQATDFKVLQLVQDAIRKALATGEVAKTPTAIDAILDEAGVGPRQSGYSDLVWRTNAADAYAQGHQEEIVREAEYFPVWRYSNPKDSRSRPHHAARDGNYYPTSVPFDAVRGTDIGDKASCRCVAVAIFRDDWKELRAAGARIADGYPDVPV